MKKFPKQGMILKRLIIGDETVGEIILTDKIGKYFLSPFVSRQCSCHRDIHIRKKRGYH